MSVRRLVTSFLLLITLTAAGCSSSGSSSKTTSPSAPVSASSLAAKIRKGLSGVTSAHMSIDAGGLGGTSAGVFKFANGSATASDFTTRTDNEKAEVVTVGSTSYAKLPAGKHTSGKRWVKVTPNSKDAFIRGLGNTLPLISAVGSLNQLASVIGHARSVQDKGATTLNGVRVHRYTLRIPPSAAGTGELGDLLRRLGGKPVPTQLWLDAKNRPVRIQLAVNVAGKAFPLVITISRYNAPVSIKAPSHGTVSTG
jgi:hypothetical protein